MKSQINALTATRGFAALMVFIFHFGRDLYPFSLFPSIFSRGNIAVSYFYVLSGFVLYISYASTAINYSTFIRKRLARIAPAYWLALFLFVLVCLFRYRMAFNEDLITKIILSALFIQAYIPAYALVLNTAAWSISVEMFFYILFPFLIYAQNRNARFFIVSTIIIYLVTQYTVTALFDDKVYNFFIYSPFMHINQFMVGMVGGYLFKQLPTARKTNIPYALALLCLMLFALAIKPEHIFYDVGLIAPLFMVFILSIAWKNPAFLKLRPLVFFGEISYGFYILQFPVHESLKSLNEAWLKMSELGFFFFTLLALTLAATLSYYFLELPVRNRVNRAVRNKEMRINKTEER